MAARVLDRLEMEAETRRPALALLFRGFAAARPLMLPSLVPAALVLVSVLAGVLALDPGPLPEVHLAPGAWGAVPAVRHRGQPALPVRGGRRSRARRRAWTCPPRSSRAVARARCSSRPSWPATAPWPA